MSDAVDMFKAQRELRQGRGFENRLRAESDFPRARRRLAAAGLYLFRHSDAHYTLRSWGAAEVLLRPEGEKGAVGELASGSRGWLINIYPGNRRITRGGNAPWLELPAEWTLFDVADAAVKLKGERDG